MGPPGPLVRFDQSPRPFSLLCPSGAGLRRSSPAKGGSSRASEAREGSTSPRRSSRWSTGRRGRRGSSAASSAAEGASVTEWFWGECGSRSKSSGGLGSWRGGGVLGKENWEGEALVALGELGPWRRPLLPEVGKTTSSGRLAAMGRLGECTEAACERNVLGGLLK